MDRQVNARELFAHTEAKGSMGVVNRDCDQVRGREERVEKVRRDTDATLWCYFL